MGGWWGALGDGKLEGAVGSRDGERGWGIVDGG